MLNFELKNGERYLTNGDESQDRIDFGYILRDNLGYDAWSVYKNIVDDLEFANEDGDDYEQVADEYRGMLIDTMNELETLVDKFYEELSKGRLNRDNLNDLVRAVNRVRDGIYKNM